jgi:thiosulfate/3-mercaptopyruvate sulfurtransferase
LKAELLVGPETLARHLDDPTWVVIDCRADLMNPAKAQEAYALGHVPGAFFARLDDDLAGARSGRNGRHPLPDVDAFASFLQRCGVEPHSLVVAYDDAGGSYAVRLWWMLRWLGHERVALLDGGWPAWSQGGFPVSSETPPARAGHFTPKPRADAMVDAVQVERLRQDPASKLLDARAAERYAGKTEPIDPVAGHIPGAVNRFWKDNLASDGRFKLAGMLHREFDTLLAGTAPEAVVHSCGSGVTACHNAFAMALAGLPIGRLYPGSWSEWCSDPARPVARD